MIQFCIRIVKMCMKTFSKKTSATRTVHLGLIGLMFVAALAVYAEAEMYRGYEMPPYEVTRSNGEIELRDYQPHLLAEVTVRGSRSGAIGKGFRTLANYIFGGNAENEKVSMTVPVAQTAADDSTWRINFMMPSRYTMDTLPAAENPAIRFVTAPAERQIVIGFSGRGTDRLLARKTEELRAYAAAEGLTINGAPRYYFYDDPFTMPWNRRNEVAFAVR